MPPGENPPVGMAGTGKDRASHLVGTMHMCIAWWRIASLIGFFSCCFF